MVPSPPLCLEGVPHSTPSPLYHDPNAPLHCGGLGMCLLQKDQLVREMQRAAGQEKSF